MHDPCGRKTQKSEDPPHQRPGESETLEMVHLTAKAAVTKALAMEARRPAPKRATDHSLVPYEENPTAAGRRRSEDATPVRSVEAALGLQALGPQAQWRAKGARKAPRGDLPPCAGHPDDAMEGLRQGRPR